MHSLLCMQYRERLSLSADALKHITQAFTQQVGDP